jgi:hypothetical protein
MARHRCPRLIPCQVCLDRAERMRAIEASGFTHWDRKIDRHQERLGSGTPSSWINSYVKP